MTLILDIIFALSQSIPKLDSLVPRTRDDLPVVSAETDGQHIGCVSNESTGGEAGVKVPESECVIP